MNNWAQLTKTIPEEHREELAAAILEALGSATWCQVNIEIRDHHLHAVSITKSKLLHHPLKATCIA